MEPTENDLFEEVLAAFDRPEMYDPAIHLHPETAAARWHVHKNTALDKLRKMAETAGLVEVVVYNPETGRNCVAFKRRM